MEARRTLYLLLENSIITAVVGIAATILTVNSTVGNCIVITHTVIPSSTSDELALSTGFTASVRLAAYRLTVRSTVSDRLKSRNLVGPGWAIESHIISTKVRAAVGLTAVVVTVKTALQRVEVSNGVGTLATHDSLLQWIRIQTGIGLTALVLARRPTTHDCVEVIILVLSRSA